MDERRPLLWPLAVYTMVLIFGSSRADLCITKLSRSPSQKLECTTCDPATRRVVFSAPYSPENSWETALFEP